MSQIKQEIRVVTYMCPTHPIELYQLILDVLEKTLECYTTLQYECRSPGPFPDRPDPFSTDKVDLGKFFAYLRSCYLVWMRRVIIIATTDESNLSLTR